MTSSHLFRTKLCAVKGKSKEELVSLKLLVSNMGPPNTGPTMGRRHALRWGQAEGKGNRNLLYFSLSHLVDLCLSTISAEALRHTETLYENLNLSCWEKSAAFPPQAQVDLGTSYRYTQLGLCEVMSYFSPFKSCAHRMLWVKRRQVVLGLKWSLFMCSLPSSCPFPKLEPFSLSCP